MASRYRVSDVVRLLDADDFRLSESDNSDCEDDEVVGYLPEVEQRLGELEQSQEDGQGLSDRSDHKVTPFRDANGSGKPLAWCQDSCCTLYHLYFR